MSHTQELFTEKQPFQQSHSRNSIRKWKKVVHLIITALEAICRNVFIPHLLQKKQAKPDEY